jgi:opacity protein-like surface antigen
MKFPLAGLALLAVAMTGVGHAKEHQESSNSLSYSGLRAGYVSRHSDYFHAQQRGVGVHGSWLLNQNAYLLAGAERLTFDRLPGTARTYSAGIGYQENPMGNISAFLQAEFFHTRVEAAPSRFGNHVDGWARFSWGFRTLLAEDSPWELDGAVYYDSHEKFGGRSFGAWFGVGAAWNHFGLRLLGNHNAAQDTVRFDLSVYF